MESYLNVTVRVAKAQAEAAIASLRGQLTGLQAATRSTSTAGVGAGAESSAHSLDRLTGSIRSAGYALSTTFTAPILLAGRSLLKFNLQNETAMADLKKVYGSNPLADYSKDIDALGRNFKALSNEFGVNQTEVIQIGAAWAQAGVQGAALAQSVQNTLKAMVIGDLSSTDATTALISIQGQYGASASDLTKILNDLNVVENTTAISMEGLITGFQRAAGAAANGGVTYRELAALLASITPYAGTAAQAGNSLKTIISNLEAPSAQAADALSHLNINLNDPGWKSATATDKLREVAAGFEKLSGAQKNVEARALSGAFQVSRFDVLLRDIALSLNPATAAQSRFGKALAATTSDTVNAQIAQRELQTVLDSNPKKLQIIGDTLKNKLADVLVQLMPLILNFADAILRLVTWFSNLNPNVQKIVGYMLAFLAVLGPVLLYVSALMSLFKTMGLVISFLAGPLKLVLALFGLTSTSAEKSAAATERSMREMLVSMTGNSEAGAASVGASMKTMLAEVLATMREMLSVIGGIWAQIDGLQLASSTRQRRTAATTAAEVADVTAAGVAAVVETTTVGMSTEVAIFEGAAASMTEVWTAAWRYLYNVTVVGMAGVAAEIEGGLAAITGSTRAELVLYDAEFAAAQMRTVAATEAAWAENVTITRIGAAEMATAGTAGAAATSTGMLAGLARLPGAILGFFTAIPGRIVRLFIGLPGLIIRGLSALLPMLAGLGSAIFAALTGPWGIAIAAVVLAVALFRKQIGEGITDIVNWFKGIAPGVVNAFQPLINIVDAVVKAIIGAFNALPQGVHNALQAVVNIVESAAKAIYNLFSYINPFAHHSPSLVENVTNGMNVIKQQFESLTDVEPAVNRAYAVLQKFSKGISTPWEAKVDVGVKHLQKDKASSGQVEEYRALGDAVGSLLPIQSQYNAAINRQKAIVEPLKTSLDAANAALQKQKDILSGLTATQQKYSDQMTAAKDALSNLASTPIAGQKALGDQIDANTLKQKQLQLQMMQIEDVTGPMSDVQDKMSTLAGEMDSLRGQSSALRQAGAGTDITGIYDGQVAQLQGQYDAVKSQVSDYDALAAQLAAVQHQGSELSLINDITFDPLEKQIKDLADTTKELPFDQIVAQIQEQNQKLATSTQSYDTATAAVNRQKTAVATATATRNAAKKAYDDENVRLKTLKDSYEKVTQAIGALKAEMGTISSAASSVAASRGASPTNLDKNFAAAAGGNFPTAVGKGDLNAGKSGDIKGIDALTKQATEGLDKTLGKLNPFKGIKEKWGEFTGWWSSNVTPNIKAFWNELYSGGGKGGAIPEVFKGIGTGIDAVLKFLTPLWHGLQSLWALFKPDIIRFWDVLKSAFLQIGNDVGPKLLPFFKALGGLIEFIWPYVKILAEVLGVILLGAIKILTDILTQVLGPVLHGMIEVFAGLLEALTGVINFIVGVFTGDWKKAWLGVKEFFAGIWNAIFGLVRGFFGLIAGVVKGFIDAIIGFFEWLYDELVGHSIVPDMIKAIAEWFGRLPGMVLDALVDLGIWLAGLFLDALSAIWDAIEAGWKVIAAFFSGLPGTVLSLIGDLGQTLYNEGHKLLTGAWNGIKFVWNNIILPYFTNFVPNLLKKIVGWDVALYQKGFDLLRGAYNGLRDLWSNSIVPWFQNLPSRAVGFFTKSGTWLYKAGASIAKGLYDGIQDGLKFLAKVFGTPIYWAVKYAIDPIIKGLDYIPGVNIPQIDPSGIPHFRKGGVVPGGHDRDDVPIYATPGEVVVPKRAVAAAGGAQALMRALGFNGSGSGNHFAGGGAIPPLPAGSGSYQTVGGSLVGNTLSAIGSWGASEVDSGVKLLRKGAADVFVKTVANPIKKADNALDSMGAFGVMLDHGLDSIIDKVVAWIRDRETSDQKKYAKIDSVGDHKALMDAAFNQLHIKPNDDLYGALNIIVSNESGWNPNAINLTDSNAKAGHPSQGLMQTIPGTFEANRLKSLPDVITDPLANLVAGINYANRRYGSLDAVPGVEAVRHGGTYIGYDAGGILAPGITQAVNMSGKPEAILTNSQWLMLQRVASGAASPAARANATVPINTQPTASAPSITYSSNDKTTIVKIEKVEFPNIKSSADAKDLLDSLESLANGSR